MNGKKIFIVLTVFLLAGMLQQARAQYVGPLKKNDTVRIKQMEENRRLSREKKKKNEVKAEMKVEDRNKVKTKAEVETEDKVKNEAETKGKAGVDSLKGKRVVAGKDSVAVKSSSKAKSKGPAPPGYKPKTAIIRSAIVPGWGQITNKKYWKLPIVYGALGTTTYIFFDNIKTYKQLKFAYAALVSPDTEDDKLIDPSLPPALLQYPNSVKTYRNQFRRNIDYSVLFFLVFWGLNVADAAVDSHLRYFDVSNDLSLQIKPGYSPNNNTFGISLTLDIHKGKSKPVKWISK
jgi:Family of unknown function (DUF5683)